MRNGKTFQRRPSPDHLVRVELSRQSPASNSDIRSPSATRKCAPNQSYRMASTAEQPLRRTLQDYAPNHD